MLTYILIGILCSLILAVIGTILYILLSPMPVVKLLRRSGEGPSSLPENYKDVCRDIKVIKDITYPSRFNNNTFDLYLPSKSKDNCPLILWVHGGAFVAGDKSGTENWGYVLAANGYAVASMNYEWAPEAPYPSQLIQINECISKLLECKQYPINTKQIVLAGDSAGAHMAAQFAALHTNDSLAQKLNVKSPIPHDALKGLLLYCGPFDLEKMFHTTNRKLRFYISRLGWCYFGKRNWSKLELSKTVNIAEYVTENYPPAYITDGNHVSFESHGKLLVQALENNKVYVNSRFFDKSHGEVNHEYQMELAKPEAMLCLNDTKEFLERIL